MLTTNAIRTKFANFFAGKGHTVVASDSVVPKNDPTVLFTTAGMQQFKRHFLGQIDDYTRAASCQKCIRTDDLDQVGETDFHHTFFEMLGNFSFGDYFKQEAIGWAWEFLTKELGLPAERLWVSVYRDDREAESIWRDTIKIPDEKIFRLGDKSNFWPSNAKKDGPNGPCGPCSEIFYDYAGPNAGMPHPSDPDDQPGRFSEVWNLVFTQFNRKDEGLLEPLPSQNIDTGMGLERLAAVVQGKTSNFETDGFAPLLEAVRALGFSIPEKEQRIIADHIRAVVFAIGDGVIPSNKERGFVIKGLINRCVNIVAGRGATGPCIHRLVPAVAGVMMEPYPELPAKQQEIASLVKKVEEAFIEVRKKRLPEFEKKIRSAGSADDRGRLYFEYHDTHGLPITTIAEVARTRGGLDDGAHAAAMRRYHQLMDEQRDRSRSFSKMAGDVFTDADLELDVPKSRFLGYDQFESQATVLKLFRDNRPVESAGEGEDVKIVLDCTPFYAEAGGQVGDTGHLRNAQGDIRVTDTQKIADIIIHRGTVKSGTITAGSTVTAAIDAQRRLSIMRNHTATHLLQAALRHVLGGHVQQQGSLVAEDRLRFDFTHPQAIREEDIRRIERYINARVLACDPVNKDVLPIREAKQSGALAFFAEKYGETVRVVSIGDYSKEFCGGTHLDATGQIGLFKVTAESAIAQGIRRIEARTGLGALDLVEREEDDLNRITEIVKASKSEVVARVTEQAQKNKWFEKELEKIRLETIRHALPALLEKAETVAGVKIVQQVFPDAQMNTLRRGADLVKQKEPEAVIIFGSQSAQAAALLVAATDRAVKKGVKADEIVNRAAAGMNGSGGGRPNMAQAGSKDPAGLPDAVRTAVQVAKTQLAGVKE